MLHSWETSVWHFFSSSPSFFYFFFYFLIFLWFLRLSLSTKWLHSAKSKVNTNYVVHKPKVVSFFTLSHSCKGKKKDSLKRAFTRGKKVSDSWRSTKQVSCTHSIKGRSFTAGQLGGSTGGRLCVLQTASPPGTDLSLWLPGHRCVTSHLDQFGRRP